MGLAFKDLRPGNQIYILDRSGELPEYITGNIISVSQPRFETNNLQQLNLYADRILDLTIKIKDVVKTFVVKENASSASDNTQSIACNTENITSEIEASKKASTDILDSVERHKALIQRYNEILESLSPIYADNQQQAKRMDALESTMSKMVESMNQIQDFLFKRKEE